MIGVEFYDWGRSSMIGGGVGGQYSEEYSSSLGGRRGMGVSGMFRIVGCNFRIPEIISLIIPIRAERLWIHINPSPPPESLT